MKVAIVGSGAVGSAVAASLARSGADVTLVEARRPCAGTSGTTFAWVNANDKQPRSYHELNLAGLAEHHAMVAAGHRAFRPSGHLEIAATEQHAERLHHKVARLRSWGYPVSMADSGQVEDLVPGLTSSAGSGSAAWYPDEGYCDVSRLVADALGVVHGAGGLLRPATVQRVVPRASGVDLHLTDGSVARFDTVVVAAGRWSETLLAGSGLRLPLHDSTTPGSALFGFLTTTYPIAIPFDRVLTTAGLNVRPDGHGRLLLQALDLDGGAHPDLPVETRERVAHEMATRLRRLFGLPYLPDVMPAVVGIRALPADGLTVSGFVDQGQRVYVTVTHSGITLAPLLGRLAAMEVFGERSGLLDDFRPGRFDTAPAVGPPAPARRAGEQ